MALRGLEQRLLETWGRVTRRGVVWACFIALVLSGCFLPVPIEEEEPEPEFRPEIVVPDDVSPNPLSLILGELGDLPLLRFGVLNVKDANEDETLYWRAVYDTGSRAVRFKDGELPPDVRGFDTLFAPCSQIHRLFVEESRDNFGNFALITMYFAVADTPFSVTDLQTLPPNAVEKQLATDLDRPLTMVSWTIRLDGECPL